MTRPRAAIAVALTAALALSMTGGGPPLRATETKSVAEREAEQAVRDMLSRDATRGTIPGVLVVRGGDRYAARNASRAMIPASLMKLPVTAAALMRFGAEHRFATRALVTTPRGDGSVGRLVLVGGGDPTLARASYRRRYLERRSGMAEGERIFPSGSPTIAGLARAIESAGVTRVRGKLLADDSLFDRVRTQAGWKSSYLDRSTGGPHVGLLSALVIDQGYADLRRTRVARSPAMHAARALRDALERRGIAVGGGVVYREAPEGAAEVARVESPPLREIVGWVNRWSINHPAELLLKGMGAAFGAEGSTEAGAQVMTDALAAARVDTAGFRVADGSGLSPLNRTTPRFVAGVIRWGLREDTPEAVAFRRSFPVACRPGALLYRMCDTRAEGNTRGKTAMITDVRGMAGFARGSDGKRTVYVALFNSAENEMALTGPLDLLGRRLARLG